jgi:hypothetical protein
MSVELALSVEDPTPWRFSLKLMRQHHAIQAARQGIDGLRGFRLPSPAQRGRQGGGASVRGTPSPALRGRGVRRNCGADGIEIPIVEFNQDIRFQNEPTIGP